MNSIAKGIMVLVVIACHVFLTSNAYATTTEDKAAAIVQILKEQKDAADKARLEKAREDITGITAARKTGSEVWGVIGWMTLAAFILAILKAVIFNRHRFFRKYLEDVKQQCKIENNDSEAVRKLKEERLESIMNEKDRFITNTSDLSYFKLMHFAKKEFSEFDAVLQKVRETGKLEITVDRKICRNCVTVNDRLADTCKSCGKKLPSEAEIIKSFEEATIEERMNRPILAEQSEALKKGLKEFSELIESRARAVGYMQLLVVAAAYRSGKIASYDTWFGNKSVDFKGIYVPPPEKLTDPGDFLLDRNKTLAICVECLGVLVSEIGTEKRSKKALTYFAEILIAVAELVAGKSLFAEEGRYANSSELYGYLAKNDKSLLMQIQDCLIELEINLYADYLVKKNEEYQSIAERLDRYVPMSNLIDEQKRSQADGKASSLLEEKIKRDRKRKAKKEA